MTRSPIAIGVDLGGTKIEALALDPDGREIWRRRVPTPAGDYAGTLRAIAELVAAAGAKEFTIRSARPGAWRTTGG